jgi:penicillin-binding protein 2
MQNKLQHIHGKTICISFAVLFALGFVVLSVKLRNIQILSSANHSFELAKQSVRRIQTEGIRGRILDRNGVVLADNVSNLSIALNASFFRKKSWAKTSEEILAAVKKAQSVIGRSSQLTIEDVELHIKRRLALPLVVWNDVSDEELARFFEHEKDMIGFFALRTLERKYPFGSLACHLIGYVGKDRAESDVGDRKINFYSLEMRGRSGVEFYYNGFLRGVPGEKCILVDARGFSHSEWTTVEAQKGPDIDLSIDASIQKVVEQQFNTVKGACVVMDADTGEILAMASAPGYNLNDFVPVLTSAKFEALSKDPSLPLLNRAVSGTYAPGSTFKPVTAVAALLSGMSTNDTVECEGYYVNGGMQIRCSRLWGHGRLDVTGALRDSCNPFFCTMADKAGIDSLVDTSKKFGLGSRTGIDFPAEAPGLVPTPEWKVQKFSEQWYSGDLAQMSIGQGMLLTTPLQMARIAAAIGTGRLVTPVLRKGAKTVSVSLPFGERILNVVRKGMRLVILKGTGKKAGENVNAYIIGKTGTAEVGKGQSRRKNAWFIAFAKSNDGKKKIALSIVVENGDSGGGTAAPRAAAIMRKIFNDSAQEEG